jgi:hypothetical protein
VKDSPLKVALEYLHSVAGDGQGSSPRAGTAGQ